MEINYQVVVDLITNMMAVSFPVYLVFMICEKVSRLFINFIRGDKEVKI